MSDTRPTKVIFGDAETASAVAMQLENAWEIARDDSEYERKEAIESAIALLEPIDVNAVYPAILAIPTDAIGDEILSACEQIEEDPEIYELESAAIAYDFQ